MRLPTFVFILGLVASGALGACARAGAHSDNNNNGNDNDNGNHTQVSGHPAAAVVSGGTVMRSASYRLVLTTGQSPGGNGVATSSSYQLRGGVVGATQ